MVHHDNVSGIHKATTAAGATAAASNGAAAMLVSTGAT